MYMKYTDLTKFSIRRKNGKSRDRILAVPYWRGLGTRTCCGANSDGLTSSDRAGQSFMKPRIYLCGPLALLELQAT